MGERRGERVADEALAMPVTRLDRSDPDVIALIAELQGAARLRERFEATVIRGYTRTSRAAEDADSPLGGLVMEVASASLGAGIDHLQTWHSTTKSDVQPDFAHASLARGAIDGAAKCRWVVDPTVSAATRLERAAAASLEDYQQRRKFEQAFGPSLGPYATGGESSKDRAEALRQLMTAEGIPESSPPKWIDLYRDYAIPGANAAWRGEALYRYLSGYAHGFMWSALSGTTSPASQAEHGRVLIRTSEPDTLVTRRFAEYARAAVTQALREFWDYTGGTPTAQTPREGPAT